MSRLQTRNLSPSAKAFGNPSKGGFGGFSASSGSDLSYLAEPPDFSTINDANVVVSFKNVLKKDSTTKAKGLEDLVAYVQARPFEVDGGTEDSILDIWVGKRSGHLSPKLVLKSSSDSGVCADVDRQLAPSA